MATEIRMPDMGAKSVTILAWLKSPGDPVGVGEPLFEVETDKGVTAVEAALGGILERILVLAGGKAGPGETVALIRRWGEEAPSLGGALPQS
jgi:pyruvate/2-oxoglutarate dehydrogenase complex dihydrolipoamide acyltransferase (E2) component